MSRKGGLSFACNGCSWHETNKMIMRTLALFLLTAPCQIANIDAQAQWRVEDAYDQWGEKKGIFSKFSGEPQIFRVSVAH